MKAKAVELKKLISEIDLGNLKPSQFLQKLKSGNRCVNRTFRCLVIFSWHDFQALVSSVGFPKYS